METQSRITVEECRDLLTNSNNLSDEELLRQRNRLYDLARFLVEKFEKLTDFFTRAKTIDAKARIVK